MGDPVRIQLSRRKGFKLQEHSIAINGLSAVKVDRSTKWGNPYVAGDPVYNGATGRTRKAGMTAEEAVAKFRKCQCVPLVSGEIVRELRGKNLGCWCKIGEPCHGDVLLEIANRPICEASPALRAEEKMPT